MQARNNLFTVSSPLLRQVIIKSGMMGAASDELASRLAALCEQFYLNRQIEQLTEAAELLVSLPGESAQAVGRFYLATPAAKQGDLATAINLLESVAGCKATPRYRARALQSLGLAYRYKGDRDGARRLYELARSNAARLPQQDFVTIIRAGMTLSDLSAIEGDHRASIEQLKAIRPVVELAAIIAPVYAPMWCNNVALDLAGLGRIDEARRFAAFAVASPYARAYPEWLETAQEIEQQAEAKAAHKSILRVEVRLARSRARKRPARTLFLSQKLALKASRRRLQPRTAIFPRELPRSRPTLEQVSLKIKIRAPSF